jgi:3,4-dihydroxy-2-butanone 4-phosphate synthase
MAVVVDDDDADRENEGHLVITAEAVNFMTTHGRGLICLSLEGERCDRSGICEIIADDGTTMRAGLEGSGVRIRERVPIRVRPNATNRRYLETKSRLMGHQLSDGVERPSTGVGHLARQRRRDGTAPGQQAS